MDFQRLGLGWEAYFHWNGKQIFILEANECYSFEEHLSLPPDVESSKITLELSYIFLHLCHVVLINVSRENKIDTKVVREVCLTTLIAKIIYFLSETNYHEKY